MGVLQCANPNSSTDVLKHKALDRNRRSHGNNLHRLYCAVCNVVLFITNATDRTPAADIQHSQRPYDDQIGQDEMGETCSVLPGKNQAYKL
jgi:hypothetical protein